MLKGCVLVTKTPSGCGYYKEGNNAVVELLSASRCAFHNHMHLDRTNIASKMIVKMLTHSHMTRSLGGVSMFVKAVEFER
jgi:hypothetical protein